MPPTKNQRRDEAVRTAARDVLRIEVDMTHRDAQQVIAISELRKALELVYTLAERPVLRSVEGGLSPAARADAAEAKVRELEARNAAMLKLADERVVEAARLELKVRELEAYVSELKKR